MHSAQHHITRTLRTTKVWETQAQNSTCVWPVLIHCGSACDGPGDDGGLGSPPSLSLCRRKPAVATTAVDVFACLEALYMTSVERALIYTL